MMLCFLVLQVIVNISGYFANDLPTNIPRCLINDPKIGDCILKAANNLRPRIREGINEIGIPSYDPLVLSHFHVIQESNMVNYTNILWNFTIRGMDNYDITEIKYNPETMTFKGNLQFDPLSIQTVYNIKGRLLFFPIRGNGNIHAALGPINGTFEITGDMMKRKNNDYYNPKDIKIKLKVDDMSIYIEGLFDGDQELAALTNNLVNQNSKLIVEAITPSFEKISEKFIMRYFKWLTKTYPYYELFSQSSKQITM